jgi:excisionase family DNA binding protein
MVNPSDIDDLMTLTEAGELIRVSRSSMYRMVRAGHLEVVKIPGGQTMTTRRMIAEMLERSTVPPRRDAS